MEQTTDAVSLTVTRTPAGTRVSTWRGDSAADVFARAEAAWMSADNWQRGAFPTLKADGEQFVATFAIYSAE